MRLKSKGYFRNPFNQKFFFLQKTKITRWNSNKIPEIGIQIIEVIVPPFNLIVWYSKKKRAKNATANGKTNGLRHLLFKLVIQIFRGYALKMVHQIGICIVIVCDYEQRAYSWLSMCHVTKSKRLSDAIKLMNEIVERLWFQRISIEWERFTWNWCSDDLRMRYCRFVLCLHVLI